VNDVANSLSRIMRSTAQVVPIEGLEKKLKAGKPLRIKLGMDPTAPDLHLGHGVVLRKLREFQDMGHIIQLVIGDFTARIGDPSGKSKTRPPLSTEQIEQNAKTYVDQVGKIIDVSKAEIHFNSTWLSRMSLADWTLLCGKVTVARILERDDFQKRLAEHTAIGLHELFYPMMQGYDSVVLKSDVELGGTDQTFNLLMGRFLQEQHEQCPQVILTMPILEGLDGVQKMSKSLGNYIGLAQDPSEAYGKLMSISDDLMWRYYLVLLQHSEDDVAKRKAQVQAGVVHPMDAKKQLARSVVEQFWSESDAQTAQKSFEALFQKHDYSQAKEVALSSDIANPAWVVDLLRALDAIKTSSEARRLITSGAVKVDEQAITDFKAEIAWSDGMIIRVGKHRFYKLKRAR
jgi:tyrosyl-tRNA synthetase